MRHPQQHLLRHLRQHPHPLRYLHLLRQRHLQQHPQPVKIVAQPGQALKPGDSIVILESMKMEIPIVAPQEGTLASIDTTEGASVENGDILATMN